MPPLPVGTRSTATSSGARLLQFAEVILTASTDPDPAWAPWLDFFPAGTPAHPEYPSGHSTVSGAAAFVLTAAFGDETAVTLTSEVRPGTRTFASFSSVLTEIADARVFGGIHFRTS